MIDVTKPQIISLITTPIGMMYAISDDDCLYELQFIDSYDDKQSLLCLLQGKYSNLIEQENELTALLRYELNEYFCGALRIFSTPISLIGSQFQNMVWQSLLDIEYGYTISYKQQAANINSPKAYRAVANANGSNKIHIIVPCHRVVHSDGGLGGYKAGLVIKDFLLKHELKHC